MALTGVRIILSEVMTVTGWRRWSASILTVLLLLSACTATTPTVSPVPIGIDSGLAATGAAGAATSSGSATANDHTSESFAPSLDDGQVRFVARTPATVFGYLSRTPGRSADSATAYSTIIYLHGLGERGDGSAASLKRLEGTGLPNLAATHELPPSARRFLILAPQTDDTTWNPALIHRWLEQMMLTYPIDPHHLYLTGVSMGGGGVVAYLNAYGKNSPFAAAAPISGDWTPPGSVMGLPSCDRLSTTPLWAFAGDIDDVVPYQFSINLIAYLNRHCQLTEPDRLTLYKGRFHDVWTHTYNLAGQQDKVDPPWQPYTPDLYTWLLQHRRA